MIMCPFDEKLISSSSLCFIQARFKNCGRDCAAGYNRSRSGGLYKLRIDVIHTLYSNMSAGEYTSANPRPSVRCPSLCPDHGSLLQIRAWVVGTQGSLICLTLYKLRTLPSDSRHSATVFLVLRQGIFLCILVLGESKPTTSASLDC